MMNAIRSTKNLVKEAFPSLWLRWHLMHRPKSAETELSFLDKIVPGGTVTIDVGANCGLYTRELARMSQCVHAFEPSHDMATLLRKTAAANVCIHELALSDREGDAALFIPTNDSGLVHGLASIEPQPGLSEKEGIVTSVQTVRLDEAVQDDVAFIKIDVEGHELNVLRGATSLIERSQPVFLVEAEDRHRSAATASVFEFFRSCEYSGFFVDDGDVLPIDDFDVDIFQDADSLLSNGGRKPGRSYVNNFFFFPSHQDGWAILNS